MECVDPEFFWVGGTGNTFFFKIPLIVIGCVTFVFGFWKLITLALRRIANSWIGHKASVA